MLLCKLLICMASRYPDTQVLDYCLNPVHVSKNGRSIFVPCGHCSGCLLHSSNLWSQRLSQEIEFSQYSIFLTLTYRNEYLPVMHRIDIDDYCAYFPIWNNIRCVPKIDNNGFVSGYYDARREDTFYIECDPYIVPITNYHPSDPFVALEFLAYPSKRDIVLWLKNVRKCLNNRFKNESATFRYYIISELGGEKYRPHYHAIIFVENREWADFLKEYALFACWAMCDKTLFDDNTKYCNFGTAKYLTEYVTVPSDLPRVYQFEATKNFRLSSKSPAIGFCRFTKDEVFENVSIGNITYTRELQRLGQSSILQYPANYCSTLFPKCRGFSTMSFDRLLAVYGYLYKAIYRFGSSYDVLYSRLSSFDSQSFNAQRACLRYCESLGFDAVFHYVFLVDMYYYKVAMTQLASWYKWLEKQGDIFIILASYNNIEDFLLYKKECFEVLNFSFDLQLVFYFDYTIYNFPDYARYDFDSLITRIRESKKVLSPIEYGLQCDDILKDASKMRDYNELIGAAPHIV